MNQTPVNGQQQPRQQQQQNMRDREIALLRRRISTASIMTSISPSIPHFSHFLHLNHYPDDSFSSTESVSTTDFTNTGTDTDVSDSPAAAEQKKRLVKRRRKVPSKSSEHAKTKLSASSSCTSQGLIFFMSLLWWPFSWFEFSSSTSSFSKRQSQQHPTATQYKLPPKKTLVLDLDETLVHSTSTSSRHHDHIIEVLVDKHVCLYYVYKRPGVDAFLKKVSQWYKVVVFTASMPEYADPVIDWLDKDRTLISRRYFRQSCTLLDSGLHFTKDLSIVEPDLSTVVLLDNSPLSFAINPENCIPIETWTHDLNDEGLLDLLPFLDALRFTDDVRSVLSLRL
ncbi:Nuclear envelope morphology protein 1 [Physocladia obscura]|uniref:Nuclear envelope morphology protein 1 n=1 Tax=Physocladia obscura TaxID=109957 RepID=A0AAD5SU51_9FUNG|nr:Nuclear envelope morphology protein 1 [Physocladia obscura]